MRRRAPCPISPNDIARLDAVLLTHGHYDHCDVSSLRALARRHPDLAGPLAGALNNLAAMPKGASAGQAMAAVSELERILEQITDDSRGISRPSRRPQG